MCHFPPSLLALAKSPTLLALAGTLALATLSVCGTSALATLGTSSFGRTTCVRNHYRLKEENNGKYPVIFCHSFLFVTHFLCRAFNYLD
jgi:hypothetical protein